MWPRTDPRLIDALGLEPSGNFGVARDAHATKVRRVEPARRIDDDRNDVVDNRCGSRAASGFADTAHRMLSQMAIAESTPVRAVAPRRTGRPRIARQVSSKRGAKSLRPKGHQDISFANVAIRSRVLLLSIEALLA